MVVFILFLGCSPRRLIIPLWIPTQYFQTTETIILSISLTLKPDDFSWWKCYSSGHQPLVVLAIVASFFFSHFISNTFRIILVVPSKQVFCNSPIVKSNFNFSVHFSKCFVTVPNVLITTGITSTILIFQILATSYFNSLLFVHFCSSFLSMRVSNGHVGSISRHFLLFLSITVISGRLC